VRLKFGIIAGAGDQIIAYCAGIFPTAFRINLGEKVGDTTAQLKDPAQNIERFLAFVGLMVNSENY
jgi:hypothetical protein